MHANDLCLLAGIGELVLYAIKCYRFVGCFGFVKCGD
jgi:hypothetical protein